MALYAFSARNESEVDISEGDVLQSDISATDSAGFVAVTTSQGRRGLVPASYVLLADEDAERNAETHTTRANNAVEVTVAAQPLVIDRMSHRASSLERHYRCDTLARLVASCVVPISG